MKAQITQIKTNPLKKWRYIPPSSGEITILKMKTVTAARRFAVDLFLKFIPEKNPYYKTYVNSRDKKIRLF
jgi:hypothetical protein